ncbi:hypothetical protein AEAC466_13320 [Asticcacaulis sp. AC466]|uniref:hypothetical protein n=1 Tax=Asticcacaulis sp. AC466 TaxID=1282362 RepID=UPI0003C3F807|nr:hypothetical protein [Asticcacaulis sp. AC466]ESQ83226.1 hypothetical protein AEAC466_13320 [Asticcacaulis sp. AC466]
MSDKKKSEPKGLKKGAKKVAVYDALKEGAAKGLTGDALYAHVQSACPEAGSKIIVKAAFLTLSDPEIKDRATLDALYDLAIKHRLVEEPISEKPISEKPEPDLALAKVSKLKVAPARDTKVKTAKAKTAKVKIAKVEGAVKKSGKKAAK